jgi:integrase
MRKGELLGLEWERIDLASARIVLYDTKNGAPRGVPMNRAVYDVLMRLGPTAEERKGLVFRRRSGLAWGQIRRAFETAVTKAAIPDFRFHDLRHTAASHMVIRGASLKDVQEVLGHKDFKMTLRYAHLSPAHLRGAVERLEGLASSPPAAVQPSGQGVSRGSVPSRVTGTVERRVLRRALGPVRRGDGSPKPW